MDARGLGCRHRPMRTAIATLLALATTTGVAHADVDAEFGARGRIVLGAERLFGVVHREFRQGVYSDPELEARQSATTLTVLGGEGSPFYAFPRIGIDVFVAKRISVGLAGGLRIDDDSRDGSKPGRLPRQRYESFRYVIAPRIGFAYPLTSSLAIWARAGVTYLRYSEESTVGSSLAYADGRSTLRESLLAVTLEPMLVWKALPPAAITLAGTFDLGVWGRRDVGAHAGAENPYWVRAKASEYGASIGILLEL